MNSLKIDLNCESEAGRTCKIKISDMRYKSVSIIQYSVISIKSLTQQIFLFKLILKMNEGYIGRQKIDVYTHFHWC